MVDDFAGAGTLLSARTAAAAQDAQQRQSDFLSRYAAATSNSHNGLAGLGGGPLGSAPGGGGGGGGPNTAAANLQEHKLSELLFAKQLGMTGMSAAAAAAAAGLGGIPNLGLIGGAGMGGLLASTSGGLGGVGIHQHSQQSRATRLPCQARGMKADHNSSVRFDVTALLLLQSMNSLVLYFATF
jgi:hypothetical protein